MFNPETYHYDGKFNKRQLAKHLTTRHGNRSMGNDISALLKWRRDELDRTHQEFHDAMRDNPPIIAQAVR